MNFLFFLRPLLEAGLPNGGDFSNPQTFSSIWDVASIIRRVIRAQPEHFLLVTGSHKHEQRVFFRGHSTVYSDPV